MTDRVKNQPGIFPSSVEENFSFPPRGCSTIGVMDLEDRQGWIIAILRPLGIQQPSAHYRFLLSNRRPDIISINELPGLVRWLTLIREGPRRSGNTDVDKTIVSPLNREKLNYFD